MCFETVVQILLSRSKIEFGCWPIVVRERSFRRTGDKNLKMEKRADGRNERPTEPTFAGKIGLIFIGSFSTGC